MKQESIEQILLMAGKQEYTQNMTLHVSQVQAMLEAAYEAGQRDKNGTLKSDTASLLGERLSRPTPEYKTFDVMIQDEAGNLRPISTGS